MSVRDRPSSACEPGQLRRRAFATLQLAFLCGAALIAGGLVSFGARPATAASGTAGPIAVSVTPTSGVSDGQTVAIHAEAPNGTVIYSVAAHLCRPGLPIRTHYDWSFSGPRCPGVAVGAGDTEQSSTYSDGTGSAELDTFKVGEGALSWANANGHASTIDCGPGKPCDVVVQIEITNDTVFYSAPLCYGAGCPPEGQATDTPAPTTTAPPTPAEAAAAATAAAAAKNSQGSGSGQGGSGSSSTPVTTSAARTATTDHAAAAKDTQTLADSQTASAAAVGADQPSRGVRVFVAALAGALGAARIFAVVTRTRRRRVGGVGVA